MATLTIPNATFARLKAAAAARHISLEAYLNELAATNAPASSVQSQKSTSAERAAAANSIRELATQVKGKSTIEELIADKHAGHKY